MAPDRHSALQAVTHAIEKCRKDRFIALICLDIDNFREINFAYSLEVGDAVLQETGQRLGQILRTGDSVFRIGDDEFVVLLPSILHQDHALLAAQKVMSSFQEPYRVANQSVEIKASLGIAIYPDAARDAHELFSGACMAMDRAKASRTGYALYVENSRHDKSIFQYTRDLQDSINNNELILHYQPKYDLRSGNLCGAEALVRWPGPGSDCMGPENLIAIAEQSGLINSLTAWLLNAALRERTRWRGMDNLHIAVNLSVHDLADPDFPALVRRSLETWNVKPEQLTLEITETVMMQDFEQVIDVLRGLREIGVSLAIDDFGSGYSSLNYLQKLPVQELKIEKEFVSNMLERSGDKVIVKSVIELGHNLGLTVTAEGVEEKETLQSLKEMGCDLAQGYLFSRPVPSEAFQKTFMAEGGRLRSPGNEHRAATPGAKKSATNLRK